MAKNDKRVHVIDGQTTPYFAQIAWPGVALLPNLPATAVPIGQASITMPLYYSMVARVAQLFQSGLLMAAPVTAISFLISITFALVNRAVPSMNVFAESFSFRIVAGILVFGLTLGLTAQHVTNSLRRMPDDILKVAHFVSSH